MTTKIIVEANHGWPVDVWAYDQPAGSEAVYLGRVAPGDRQEFHATAMRDLAIHEVQPEELAAEEAALQEKTAATA